jgi:hypothetical protein
LTGQPVARRLLATRERDVSQARVKVTATAPTDALDSRPLTDGRSVMADESTTLSDEELVTQQTWQSSPSVSADADGDDSDDTDTTDADSTDSDSGDDADTVDAH